MRRLVRRLKNPRPNALQLVAMMGVLLTSCGIGTSNNNNTTCGAGTAQINIYDGSIRRVCGCSETSGTNFGPNQNLQCTISAGTRVYFNFINIQTNHQIVVSGVTSTHVFSPSTSSSVQTGVILMNNTGSFTFQDFNYPTYGGTFIVN